MKESKFRERRSAHREESELAPETPAPASHVGPSDQADMSRESAATPQPSPSAASSAPAEPSLDTPGFTPGTDAGEDGMDLDQLAAMDVPEPSFLELVEPHVEMALRFLGELPLTPDGDRRVLPRWAKREIDVLGILESRTRGNLPADEQRFLEQALDQLRTLYLKVAR